MSRAIWPIWPIMAAITALLPGCDPPDRLPRFRPAGAQAPRNGGTLRFAVRDQVHTLDPTVSYDEVSFFILHPLFDTLVDYSPTGRELVPRLAERWEVSPGGLIYTFDLRPNITFSDGAPITAAHFKYSLERALVTPNSPFAEMLGDIEQAHEVIEQAQKTTGGQPPTCSGIIAASDRRLIIQLRRRNPALLATLAMPFATPQRSAYVIATGDQLRRMPDATGPFMLARWDEGGRIELVRNPHYFDPARAHLDAIVMLENIPSDTQFQMFTRAELDTAAQLSAPDYLFVMGEPMWQPYVHRTDGMNAFGSRMNVTVKPFDDRRVRQALNYAADRSHTVRLLHGTATPAHGILPPGMLGRDPAISPYPHDVAKARALLAEAGYPGGFDVEYLTTNDDEAQTIATSLQSDLAEVGVHLHVSVTSFATWHTATTQRSGPAFSFTSWTADLPDPSNFFEPRFHSRSILDEDSTNDSFYANPALDALLDAAHDELDPTKREAMYRGAERILYDDAPWIWGYHRQTAEVTQPYVRGYAPHPIWSRDYTSAWLDLGPDGSPVPR